MSGSMTTHGKHAVAISCLKSVWFEHSFVSFVISVGRAHRETRWILIMARTENVSNKFPQGLRMKERSFGPSCRLEDWHFPSEDISKIIKYRLYIHLDVIHPGLLSQLEILACPVWYIRKIRAMKMNCLYLQVCLKSLVMCGRWPVSSEWYGVHFHPTTVHAVLSQTVLKNQVMQAENWLHLTISVCFLCHYRGRACGMSNKTPHCFLDRHNVSSSYNTNM